MNHMGHHMDGHINGPHESSHLYGHMDGPHESSHLYGHMGGHMGHTWGFHVDGVTWGSHVRAQLEARLREAVRDGNALAREVGELKSALKRAAHPGLPNGRHPLPNARQPLPNGHSSDKVCCPKLSTHSSDGLRTMN